MGIGAVVAAHIAISVQVVGVVGVVRVRGAVAINGLYPSKNGR